jgi:Cu2+-exporting ATPase
VVRNGKFLERLSSVNHIVFDKTGTLTEGRLEVSEVRLIDSGWSEKQVLEHCTALEKTSKHPIARAFSIPSDLSAANVSVIPGEGVSGTIQNTTYRLGKTQFVGFDELAVPDGEGIWVLLGSEQPIAWIRLNDDIRPSSIALISQLKNRFKTTLLSGDRTVEVNRVAALLGLTSTYGDKTPADKLTAIRDYQANGDCVLMVGDGVNDAAAMGAADAAIAISPVDILVQDAADATLLRQDILNISMLLNYSRRLRRIIRQNISWAAIYNFSVIPMAALGLLEPWMAALGMSMSSLLVVMNANRLARTETH